MKTNERHRNPRPQPNPRKFRKNGFEAIDILWNPANAIVTQGPQPNPPKFRNKFGQKYDFWPFLAVFSWVGLALGSEVRWFRITLDCLRKTFYTTKWAYLFTRYRRLITKPKQIWLDMGKLVIFGKHIMVETYMGDMRFGRCILLAGNSPGALDWPSFARE